MSDAKTQSRDSSLGIRQNGGKYCVVHAVTHRIGSVPFLNSAPLTRGIEAEIEFAVPSQLARWLRRDEIDAALVSVTEVLHHDRYDVLDGIAIASRGPVQSVFLAHRGPLESVRDINCDPASLTGVTLLKVLMAERGQHPVFHPLANYEDLVDLNSVMLIGDAALEFFQARHPHHIWDLGAAWTEMTGLPFVYAVWALRRDADRPEIREKLRAARDQGMAGIEEIIQSRADFDEAFRRAYLTRHIRYTLGEEEKRGLARFGELIRKHQLGSVFEPRFVQ
jgi:chorismate dehydratase